MRAKHSEAVQKLKAKFLAEKCAFQKTSDEQLSKLTKEANLVRKLHDIFLHLKLALIFRRNRSNSVRQKQRHLENLSYVRIISKNCSSRSCSMKVANEA